jgi:hypothetical protein
MDTIQGKTVLNRVPLFSNGFYTLVVGIHNVGEVGSADASTKMTPGGEEPEVMHTEGGKSWGQVDRDERRVIIQGLMV